MRAQKRDLFCHTYLDTWSEVCGIIVVVVIYYHLSKLSVGQAPRLCNLPSKLFPLTDTVSTRLLRLGSSSAQLSCGGKTVIVRVVVHTVDRALCRHRWYL